MRSPVRGAAPGDTICGRTVHHQQWRRSGIAVPAYVPPTVGTSYRRPTMLRPNAH